ncbi:MAG TPA: hypothetical protein VI072_04920 [Polyangiaceae bacterium]
MPLSAAASGHPGAGPVRSPGPRAAGWLYLKALPVDAAIERLSEDIRRYAEHLGAAHEFHRTITKP